MRGGSFFVGPITAGVTNGKDVAVTVGANFIGEVGGPTADDVLDGPFVAGGAGGFEKFFQEGVRRLVHAVTRRGGLIRGVRVGNEGSELQALLS